MGKTAADLLSGPLDAVLSGLQHIPIHSDLARLNIPTSTAAFSYDRWVEAPNQIFLNDTKVATGYTSDQATGVVTFTSPVLVAGDEVRASYRFKYFADADLVQFLNLALQDANNFRPHTSYTFDTAPEDMEAFLTKSAYKMALDVLRMDIMMWRARLIFPDIAQMMASIDAVTAKISAERTEDLKRIKGYLPILPLGVSSGRWRAASTPDQANWQQYTVIRA